MRALPILVALLLAGALLGACGGSDDDSTDTSVATQEQSTTAPDGGVGAEPGEQADGGGPDGSGGDGESEDAGDGTGQGKPSGGDRPASLETDPTSIRSARVTATGAVQTLPPSTAAQEEAMENTYGSIRAFGEESEGEEATDITFALVQYLNAKASGDWATACARIYSVLRANLERNGSCAETYGSLMSRSSAASRAEAAKIDVASVRRGEDNRAFVIYKTPDTLSADMPMYLDGGVWTVGALEAYALTPEQLRAGG